MAFSLVSCPTSLEFRPTLHPDVDVEPHLLAWPIDAHTTCTKPVSFNVTIASIRSNLVHFAFSNDFLHNFSSRLWPAFLLFFFVAETTEMHLGDNLFIQLAAISVFFVAARPKTSVIKIVQFCERLAIVRQF